MVTELRHALRKCISGFLYDIYPRTKFMKYVIRAPQEHLFPPEYQLRSPDISRFTLATAFEVNAESSNVLAQPGQTRLIGDFYL